MSHSTLRFRRSPAMEQPNEQDNWREYTAPWTESMPCRICKKKRGTNEAWYCSVCYEAREREMKELQSTISFLAVTDLDFADACFIVKNGSEETRIPVHRLILVNRSAVLKAMFTNPMEESRNGEIHITDSSPEAIKAFVDYLYSAEVSLDHSLALEVLKLAEKYQVMEVKNHCEKLMVSKLSWENSISSYTFAHKYNAKLLLEAAGEFIRNNLAKMIKHAEYQKLRDDDPALALKMFEECFLAREERNAAAST